MTPEGSPEPRTPTSRVAVYIFLLVALLYGHTLDYSWHLDDYPNIIQNNNLHVSALTPESLVRALHVPYPAGEKITRPVAMLSFALNWYFHGADTAGYHLVNIAVHFMAAVLLYLTILELLRKAPVLANRFNGRRQFIALLAAILWAVNPLQTQAITYIVQRMASMAAMFYILALYSYVRGRSRANDRRRWAWWLGGLAAFAAGLASKENAALLPLAVLLTEVIFFQDLGQRAVRRRWLWILGAAGLVFILVGGTYYFYGNTDRLLSGYGNRYFTLAERLLTQPRVIWFYLSQLFYPIPSRLSLIHDFELSTGLLQPWTTLPAILGIAGLLALGVFWVRRRPLASFALLFFFLNHAIESTIIPLEIIFEHRNYLPAMFLFVPIAAGFRQLLDRYRSQRVMFAILAGFGILVVVGWGMGTHIRNLDWATGKTLWRDAMAKAPGSFRPANNLAWTYYERIGDLDKAYALYRKSRGLEMQNKRQPAVACNNMASIHFTRGEHADAAKLYQEAAQLDPNQPNYHYRYARALTEIGDYGQALAVVDGLIARNQLRNDSEALKARLFMLQGHPDKALTLFRGIHRRSPYHPISAANLGLALTALGHYPQAEIMFKRARGLDRSRILSLTWLARVNYLAGDRADFSQYVKQLGRRFSLARIKAGLEAGEPDTVVSARELEAIDAAIFEELKKLYFHDQS